MKQRFDDAMVVASVVTVSVLVVAGLSRVPPLGWWTIIAAVTATLGGLAMRGRVDQVRTRLAATAVAVTGASYLALLAIVLAIQVAT